VHGLVKLLRSVIPIFNMTTSRRSVLATIYLQPDESDRQIDIYVDVQLQRDLKRYYIKRLKVDRDVQYIYIYIVPLPIAILRLFNGGDTR